jgi:hypothetical protein
MEVLTEPPSATPLVLAVKYKRKELPVLSNSEIQIASEPNRPCRAEVTATYKRKNNLPGLRLELERSGGKGVVLSTGKLTTEKLPGTESVVDSLPIFLAVSGVSGYGESLARVKLVFMEGTEHALSVAVRAAHPFSPRVKSVFCGRLAPSHEWSLSIPFDRHSAIAPTVGNIRVSDPVATATLESNDTLLIAGRAPVTVGRFTSSVRISFVDSAIPTIDIPVWGIVESKRAATAAQ